MSEMGWRKAKREASGGREAAPRERQRGDGGAGVLMAVLINRLKVTIRLQSGLSLCDICFASCSRNAGLGSESSNPIITYNWLLQQVHRYPNDAKFLNKVQPHHIWEQFDSDCTVLVPLLHALKGIYTIFRMVP